MSEYSGSNASDPSDSLFLAFQTAVAGRYSIDRELGRGGMGVVYLAREVHLDRLVAIKLLPPELSARIELRERFLREAQLAARLSHPNIIPIHAVEQAGDFVYFVMAYVDGETLAHRVQSRGPVSASDGIRIFREVAWALGYAHEQGVVHRDVKPDNILIEAGSGRALVADFGIAVVGGVAHLDSVSGTPEFMSPEQALGENVDARSDLYSLGTTAYYALSGRLPFDSSSTADLFARRMAEAAPSLASVGTPVPRKLAQLVDSCLATLPANRPQSAKALAEQLGVAMEHRRELPAALRAFARRNGRLDGGGTLLGLVGGLFASIATSATTGAAAGVAVLTASFVAIPAIFLVVAARRLLDLGFTQVDLGPTFRAELESSREERNVQLRSRWSVRSLVERMLRRTAEVTGATAIVCGVLAMANIGSLRAGIILPIAMIALAVATATGISYLVLLQLRRDVDIEFWNAVWTGRPGTFAFSVARKWRGTKPTARAMTHRATELSLGIAAEELFEALPKASRESLGDLPKLLNRLQQDAHRLRARYESLNDALSQVGADTMDDHAVALREERSVVHDRMREAVAALENVRLGLLRLHAGSLSLEGLTTHIGIAAEVSVQVDRLVEAGAEVEQVLRYPREVELTPA